MGRRRRRGSLNGRGIVLLHRAQVRGKWDARAAESVLRMDVVDDGNGRWCISCSGLMDYCALLRKDVRGLDWIIVAHAVVVIV